MLLVNQLIGFGAGGDRYKIDYGVRLTRASSTNLSRTPGSSGNLRKFSISFWFRRASTGNTLDTIFHCGASNEDAAINFSADNTLTCVGARSNVNIFNLATTRTFTSTTAYYHFLLVVDTAQATAADRVKLFIDGVQETSFSTATYPSQNADASRINESGNVHRIGRYRDLSWYFDGWIYNFQIFDGVAAVPADLLFGGLPIQSTLAYGTTGTFLEFKNSASLGTDTSGLGNNWTPSNLSAGDQTSTTPTS